MAKIFTGVVVSNKMQKTIVVEVTAQHTHPLYKKIINRTNKFKVHCEDYQIKPGDVVSFIETKPISKDKIYKII